MRQLFLFCFAIFDTFPVYNLFQIKTKSEGFFPHKHHYTIQAISVLSVIHDIYIEFKLRRNLRTGSLVLE